MCPRIRVILILTSLTILIRKYQKHDSIEDEDRNNNQ